MQQRLADQIAVITGAANGIGKATALRFAEEGAKVLIADIDEDGAGVTVDAIRSKGGTAERFRADIRRPEDIRGMLDRAGELWGRLDILVNNAYNRTMGGHSGALEMPEEEWDNVMSVLTKSIFLAVKYAVPQMQKSGGGNIINISSVHGLLGAPGALGYEAGKAAVIGMTRQMATEFGPTGIRVNAICPGHILSERVQAEWDENPSGLRFMEDQYPVRRAGQPVDIANAIVFLCSDEASFITGHALVVDGGLTIQLQENLGVHQAHYIREHPETQLPY